MSSILTNMSAMTAVANLNATQKSLAETQSQISSGLKVSGAKDNAAYYSIATNMRTNVGNLSAVSDSLNLGTSVVSTATAATSNITTILQSISKALVSASQPGTDLDSVQTSINALRTQLANTVGSASFNNVNLLDGSNSTNPQVKFVAGVTGLGANTTVNTLTIDTTSTNLQGAAYNNSGSTTLNTYATRFAQNTVAQAALTTALSNNSNAYAALASAIQGLTGNDLGNASGTQAAVAANAGTAAFQAVFGAGASMTTAGVVTGIGANSIAGKFLGSTGTGEKITLTLGTGVGASGTNADGASIASYANGTSSTDGTLTAVYGASSTQATTTTSATGGAANSAATATTNLTTAFNALTASDLSTANGALFAISQISLTSGNGNSANATSQAQIAAYISQVGAALTAVNNASEVLGAASSNISLQSTYTSALSDSLTSGVGSLVDADMNAASTRLSALQTQQQLGVQALSVANQSSQLILKLFQ